MINKLLIGLIVIVLALVLAVILTFRQIGPDRIREADRFNIPVMEKAMKQLSSWDYNDLKPYLGKNFIELLASDENLQKDLDEISVLGKVRSFDVPRHVSHKRNKHWLYGQCAVNHYSVSTRFEKGKGSVKFKLNQCYENAEITFFQVVSKALPTKSPALQ